MLKMNGATMNTRSEVNGSIGIGVPHENGGIFSNKNSGVKINENDKNIADINKEVVSNKNGVYTIITTVEEELPRKCDSKPYQRSSPDDQFRKVDAKKGFDPYINPVYIVDDVDENDSVSLPKHSDNLSTDQTKLETNDTGKHLNVTNQNGEERNSVIIEGEEVFLRKSPKEQRSPSREQTWKNNQNIVSDAFKFLKEIPDSGFSDALINDNLHTDMSDEQAQISRSGRQPTLRTNQEVVSTAFAFLKEMPDTDKRLSSNSLGDAQELQDESDSENKLENSNSEKLDDQNENTGINAPMNGNKSAQESLPNCESQTTESQPVLEDNSSNQRREYQPTNQIDAFVLTNQRRASETSSIASEDLGELGGFKNSKFRSNNNKDDDGDSSDEDVGVYRESFRKSTWLYIGDKKSDKPDNYIPFSELGLDTCENDSIFGNGTLLPPGDENQRKQSTSTTVSEKEFRSQYNSVNKRLVQRAESQQEYRRYTHKFYDNVETYNIEKTDRDSFGIHILDSKPAVVSGIDAGSPAEKAGVKEGQVLISVNGVNVLESDHDEIIQLVHRNGLNLKLEVGSGDLSPVLNLQLPVQTGFMQKQTSSTLLRIWKKRFFILRRDNCLYYYKNEQDTDPLGAIPLQGYVVSRHGDPNKFAFKAEKYNSKTFYFLAETREDMTRWVGALNEAGQRQDQTRDAWMEVTAHNVGLPALDIRKPDCTGYLNKMGRSTKRWRKRYCVLKDACIYYYKNSNSKEALGVAHLHGYTVDKVGVSNKKLSFSLEPPEEQMRVFTFYAENETDKYRWIAALNGSIQKWVKVD